MSRDDYLMIPTRIFHSNQGIMTQVEGNQPLKACPITTGDMVLMLSHERGTGKSFLRTTHAHFFLGYHMDWKDRSVTDSPNYN